MAQAVQAEVEKSNGKEQHAIQSFANALRKLPTIMADNAGLGTIVKSFTSIITLTHVLDSADLIANLRACHADGQSTMGLDLYKGKDTLLYMNIKN